MLVLVMLLLLGSDAFAEECIDKSVTAAMRNCSSDEVIEAASRKNLSFWRAHKRSCTRNVDESERARARLERAQVLAKEQRWEHAAAAYRLTALIHDDLDEGAVATVGYLEALGELVKRGTRERCEMQLAEDAARLTKTYCPDHASCSRIGELYLAAARRAARHHFEQADRDTTNRRVHLAAAAEVLVGVWNDHGIDACNGGMAACRQLDVVLADAGQAFADAGMVGKSVIVFRTLDRNSRYFQASKMIPVALWGIGEAYRRVAIYDKAVTWYERLAREHPKEPNAVTALENAVVLRLVLGDPDKAREAASLFDKHYSRKQRSRSAKISLALLLDAEQRGDLDEEMMKRVMPRIERHGTFDERVRVVVASGRFHRRQGRPVEARKEYAKALALWHAPKTKSRLRKLMDDDELRRAGKLLTNVGEALFFHAAEAQEKANAMKPPKLDGGKNDDEVKQWLDVRRTALEEAEKRYLEILKLRPAPPPKWLVASAAEVGAMWDALGDDMSASGLPEIAREHMDRRAKNAYRTCAEYAIKYQQLGPVAKRCHAWLTAHYEREFPETHELLPPGLMATRAPLRARALPDPREVSSPPP